MSAVPAISRALPVAVLSAPFDTWSSEAVLGYFRKRDSVRYFAVADPKQVHRGKIDDVLLNRFEFNEERYRFPLAVDWLNNPSKDVEWSILLHKFYYAVGLGMAFQDSGDHRYAQKWMELTTQWIKTVPLDFLSSDVMGRRVQNWVYAHLFFVSNAAEETVTPDFYRLFLTSIHDQINYLRQHLTPARNHRTLELYTIFLVAVVFPEFREARSWLKFAVSELSSNLQTDILDDGVHCELSTDYHHIVLRNFLAVKRLAELNRIELPREMDERIKSALDFSIYVHKPDGTIPSLSDGDTGSFLDLLQQGFELYECEQMRYVATMGKEGTVPVLRSKAFPEGGYYILRSGWGEANEPYTDERYLVFDCGPLGAGNHGHLDLLSFEMAAFGQSLIVDPGRFTYDESGETNWRVLFRGTGYHNTVRVDGKNQTRYRFHHNKFKIKGPAPDYALKAFISRPGFDYLHGIAQSLEYPVVHERKILFVNGEYWLVCDVLRAGEAHDYDLLFHLSASANCKVVNYVDQECLIVDAPNLMMIQPVQESVSVFVEPGFISPTYGVKADAPIVRFNQTGDCRCFYTLLFPYKCQRPQIKLSSLPVGRNDKLVSSYSAVCLDIDIETADANYRDFIVVANEPGEFRSGKSYFNTSLRIDRLDSQGRRILTHDLTDEICGQTMGRQWVG